MVGMRRVVTWKFHGNSHLALLQVNPKGTYLVGLRLEIGLEAGARLDYAGLAAKLREERDSFESQARAGLRYFESRDLERDIKRHNELIEEIDKLWERKPMQWWQMSSW